jgi:hypothetical protein
MASVRHPMNHHPAVSFVAPYRIYVPDEFFHALVDGRSAQVKAVPIPPIVSASASQVHGQNVEIAHDIFGFAGRTQFYIVLDENIDVGAQDWKKAICERDHEIVEIALNVVNRLLAVYRDQDVNRIGVASFHVVELVRGDLSDISLIVVDDELNQVPEFSVTWPGFRSMGFGDAVLREPQIVEAIRGHLASGTEISIERELLTSARNHLWRQQLRLVPIEANTAFESYAFSALKRADPGNTLPDSSDAIKKLLELERVFSSAAAENGKLFNSWFDPAQPGWKGLQNPALKRWHSSCYELRNKVIHRGYNSVTTAEANAALTDTQSAIAMVEQCIAD